MTHGARRELIERGIGAFLEAWPERVAVCMGKPDIERITEAVLDVALADAAARAAVLRPLANVAPESALEEAQRLVHGDRGAAYGHPIDDYGRTGRMWSAILDGWIRSTGWRPEHGPLPDVDPRIACLMMGAVKISRDVNHSKRDNRVDLAGYAECAQMVAEEQERRARYEKERLEQEPRESRHDALAREGIASLIVPDGLPR